MIFVSHIKRFSMVILHRVAEDIVGGFEREIVPSYVAQFGPGDFTVELLDFAHRLYDRQAHGRTYEIDEVTPTPLIDRLSMYDTDDEKHVRAFDEIDMAMDGRQHIDLPRGTTWAPGTMKSLVEKKLLDRAQQSTENFALFVETPIAPPWPTYEAFPGDEEERLAVLQAQGHDLSAVLAYEKQKRLRPDMVQLLEQEIAATPEAEPTGFVSA